MPGNVTKMLGTEELSLLQEVMAALQTLLNSNNAGNMENNVEGTGAQPAMMELDNGVSPPKTDDKKDDGNIDGKECNTGEPAMKSNDGPTANDKAETRTEDGTDITEGNLQGIAKALLEIAGFKNGPSPVNKSINPAQETAQLVLKAIEPAISRISMVEKDMNAMLEAFGVAEAMDTVEKSADPIHQIGKAMNSGNAPVVAPDATALFKSLAESIAQELTKEETAQESKGPKPNYSTDRTSVSKELGAAIQKVHLAYNHKGV